MKTIIGIDIGANGAIAFIKGDQVWSVNFKTSTLKEVAEEIANQLLNGDSIKAYVERVHSTPQMGVTSAFSFGERLGEIKGILTALEIPFEFVRPQEWQKALQCLSGGNKNVTKEKAQQLFPALKITHANADALLIAEHGRRTLNSN